MVFSVLSRPLHNRPLAGVLRRESAQDLKDLAGKQLLHKKIAAKVLARKARGARK